MRATRLIKVALKSIVKNKMRTLLTMLGIIIGVGAVIVMVAIGEGAQSQIAAQIQNLGTNMLVITPGSSNAGGVSQGSGSFNRLKDTDADKIMAESAYVAGVSPVIFTRTQIVGGTGNWRSTIHGVSIDYPVIRNWEMTSGRFFDASEQRTGKKVLILLAFICHALYK